MNPSTAARALGRRGGLARAARLSSAEKKEIAALGGRARSLSFHAEHRIRENFRYLDAVDALRRRPGTVTRMQTFAGPLPGSPAMKHQHAGSRHPSRHRR